MNTTCLIYLTTHIEKYQEYLHIKESISDFIDTYFFLDNDSFVDVNVNKDDVIIFHGNDIWNKYNNLENYKGSYVGNPQFLPVELSKNSKYNQYEHFYFIEDDIKMPNGDIKMFFKDCEQIDSDLLICLPPLYDDKFWFWYTIIPKEKYQTYIHHCLIQLFRISRNGCNAIIKDFVSSDKAHSECVLPSILYNNHLIVKNLLTTTKYKFNIDWNIHPEWNDKNFVFDENTWYHPLK